MRIESLANHLELAVDACCALAVKFEVNENLLPLLIGFGTLAWGLLTAIWSCLEFRPFSWANYTHATKAV